MRAAIAAALALASCGGPEQVDDPTPLIRAVGSESITSRLLPMLADSYAKTTGRARFDIQGGGSHKGMRALLDGNADLAASSRDHTPAEEEQARVNGYSLSAEGRRTILAVDVVAVSVHPKNPIGSLTYDQVIGIFCTRSIDNWSFLGLDDAPIHPVTRPAGSGTRSLFEDFFCGPAGIDRRIPIVDIDQTTDLLKADENAISFISMSEGAGKVVGLRPDAKGLPMLPSQQNIIRGAYPLYHDLYLYQGNNPPAHVTDFVSWIGSPNGQDIVDEARFVPLFLRPERFDEPRPLRETIHFEPGSSEPNQRSTARMRLLVDELRDRAGGAAKHIVLEGHAGSAEGDDPTALSQARAETVRDLLAEDLPGIYWEIIPRGAEYPIAPPTTPYGRERNRRVQIYMVDPDRDGDLMADPSDEPTE